MPFGRDNHAGIGWLFVLLSNKSTCSINKNVTANIYRFSGEENQGVGAGEGEGGELVFKGLRHFLSPLSYALKSKPVF